ncbi:MAG: hypothetical protein ACRCYS_11525 [Beijerinckiaceae bacterium]
MTKKFRNQQQIFKEQDMDNEPETEKVETPETLPAKREPKAELVASEDQGYIVPRTMDEAYRYAVAVVNAGLAPDGYKNHWQDKDANPSKVMLGIAAAMEAGLPPMYGLRQIAIIGGRPTIWGDAAMALVQSKNLLLKQTVREVGPGFDKSIAINEWPKDFGIAVSLWRRGQEEPYVGTFTVADATRAKLWLNPKKVPWIEHPIRMLTMRARAFPLRDGFADALAGLAIREEAEDMHEPTKEAVSTAFLDDEGAE